MESKVHNNAALVESPDSSRPLAVSSSKVLSLTLNWHLNTNKKGHAALAIKRKVMEVDFN